MIVSSLDGQWAAVKRGLEVMMFAGGAGPATAGATTARISLPTDDADIAMVGPPSVLAVVTRGPAAGGELGHRVVLYQPPSPEVAARHDLDAAMRIAGLTGSRLVLISRDGKAVTIVRTAGRALGTQAVDPGSPVEFAVGLERNQVLFSLLRKLETWDAVSGRPLLRMQLPLPSPPRTVGPAHGSLWVTRPGGDDIVVCRLSDGRSFRHVLGVTIDEVIYHPASPLLILVTARGLIRLHCYAHTLTRIDAPWQPGTELGQLVVGEDISLLGIAEHDDEPWRVPIGGSGAPAIALDGPEPAGEPVVTAADKLRAMRERSVQEALGGGDRADRPDSAAATERTDRAESPRLGRASGLRISLADRSDPVSRVDPPGPPGPPDAPGPPDRRDRFPRGDRTDPSEPIGRPDRTDPIRGDGGPDPSDRSGHGERPERSDLIRGGADRDEPAGRSDPPEGGDPRGVLRAAVRSHALPAMAAWPAELRGGGWRDPLAAFGAELARGGNAELAGVAAGAAVGELGELADRLALAAGARHALVALYSLYLVGEPVISLARLAHALGDWTEPLGQGELGALAMLRRRGGKLALRGSVTDVLDGVAPRAIRMIGTAAAVPRPGAARLARDGRSDAAIETELASQLGRIAVIEGRAALGLLEARLHGATAVALVPPLTRPVPWPRDAGLVVIAEPAAPAWVAALPVLTAA
jgi:hypothetical protein